MGVCRVEKKSNYTVVSNHHLQNRKLSLKAKGLLTDMLSLPDDWDYTIKGLAFRSSDGIDSINSCMKELELHGYVTRERVRNPKGQFTTVEYTIYEHPHIPNQSPENAPKKDKPSDPPKPPCPPQDSPKQDAPKQDFPMMANPSQLNIDNNKSTNSLSTNISNPNQSKEDGIGYEGYEATRRTVKKNIEYDYLCGRFEKRRLNEIVDLIVEVICSSKESINISGEDYPAQIVREKFLGLGGEHIEYIFECLDKNTTYVRNIKRYLLATLFNAPSGISNYYQALVNHDLNL